MGGGCGITSAKVDFQFCKQVNQAETISELIRINAQDSLNCEILPRSTGTIDARHWKCVSTSTCSTPHIVGLSRWIPWSSGLLKATLTFAPWNSSKMAFKLHFPRRDSPDVIAQDAECVDVTFLSSATESQHTERILFHDYPKIYSCAGLYE